MRRVESMAIEQLIDPSLSRLLLLSNVSLQQNFPIASSLHLPASPPTRLDPLLVLGHLRATEQGIEYLLLQLSRQS